MVRSMVHSMVHSMVYLLFGVESSTVYRYCTILGTIIRYGTGTGTLSGIYLLPVVPVPVPPYQVPVQYLHIQHNTAQGEPCPQSMNTVQ